MQNKIDMIYDMETGDPDDFLTFLFLQNHPLVNLKAVTVVPGTPEQMGFLRTHLHKDIELGSFKISHPKNCLSDWHPETYGPYEPMRDFRNGYEVLNDHLDENTILLTGGPLKNVGALLDHLESRGEPLKAKELVIQGGFAGEGVVPPKKQLDKFKGLKYCPTYNFNGDSKSAKRVIAMTEVRKYFVSKNVCHGVVYNEQLHELFQQIERKNEIYHLINKGLKSFRRQNHEKKLHDIFAACCAIDRDIGYWAEVGIERVNGEWGAYLATDTNNFIIISYDQERFFKTFLV